MAQHSSVRPSACATHRYIHSSAFISGHDSLVQMGKREVTNGVRSIGSRRRCWYTHFASHISSLRQKRGTEPTIA